MFNDTFEQGYQFSQIKNEIVQADNLVNVYPYSKAKHGYILFYFPNEIKRVILKNILLSIDIVPHYFHSFIGCFGDN